MNEMTNGMKRHYQRMVADKIWHKCEDCAFGIGRYPGRYPRFCSNCGADMLQQETYPRRPSPDAPIDKPLPVVTEFDNKEDLFWKLDEVARAVHVRAGLPEVAHSPSKGFVHLATVNEGIYTFAVYAPLVHRVAGTVRFESKNLTADALFAESIRVLKEFMAATPTSPTVATTGYTAAPAGAGSKIEKDKEEENVAKTVALGKDDDVGQIDQKMDKAPYTAQTEKLVPLSVDECDPFELEIGTAVEKEHTDSEEEASSIARQHLREDPAYYRKLYKAKMVQDDEIGKKLAAAAEDKWGAVKEALAEFADHLHPTRADELKHGDLLLGFEDAKGYTHHGEHIVWRTEKLPNGDIRITDSKGKQFTFPSNHEFRDVSFGPEHAEPKESIGSEDGPANISPAPMNPSTSNTQPKEAEDDTKEEDYVDDFGVTPPKTSPTGNAQGSGPQAESWEQEFRETLEKLPMDADWYSTDGGFSRIWMVSQTSGASFFWYLPNGRVNRTNHPPGYLPQNGQQISASHPKVKETIRRFFSFDRFENLLLRADNPTYQGVQVGVKDKSREDDEFKEKKKEQIPVRIKFEFEGKTYTGTMLRWGESEQALMDVELDQDLPSKIDGKTFKKGTVVRIGKRNYQKMEAIDPVSAKELEDPLTDKGKLKFKHAIAIVVKDGNSVLLGISTHDDDRKGKLCFPGGHTEKGGKDDGDVQAAACREAGEEAGIECEPMGAVLVDDDRPKHAFVVCKYVTGDLKSNWEFEKDSLRWVPFEKLDKLDNILDINRKVLQKVPNEQLGQR